MIGLQLLLTQTHKLTFFDAFTEQSITGDVNYDIKILDKDGNTALSETSLTAKGGTDTQSINLPSNGIYRIEINIKSIINNSLPDTSRIGIGRGDLVIPSTVPEFGPVASLVLVIAIISVIAVTAKTRIIFV